MSFNFLSVFHLFLFFFSFLTCTDVGQKRRGEKHLDDAVSFVFVFVFFGWEGGKRGCW